jgi:diguanylate cyclase (GGDEF)-like protein/PAS domain S-box-containing protein
MTGDWVVYLVRTIVMAGPGELRAAAEVPIASLTTPLAPAFDAPGWRLEIRRPTGQILATLPHDELRIGRLAEGTASTADDDPDANGVIAGHGLDRPFSTQRTTLYKDAKLELSADPVQALQGWVRDRNRIVIAVSIAVLLVISLAVTLIVTLQRREELEAERRLSQQILEEAIEAMSDGFVMWDADDRLVTCNRRYLELYDKSAPFLTRGAKFEDVIRKGVEAGQYPQAGGDTDKFVADVTAWHRAGEGSFERLLPDGRWLLVTERRTANGGGVGIRTDITALKTVSSELAAANERVRQTMSELQQQNQALTDRDIALRTQNVLFDAALNNMSHGLLMADADGRVIVCNRRFLDLFGLAAETSPQGQELESVLARAENTGSMDASVIGEIRSRQRTLAASRLAGTFVAKAENGHALAITQRPMRDGGFVAIYEDVTEQQRAENRIRFLAHHDPLTRLPNRALFRSSVDGLLQSLTPPDERLALLYLDLDKFKDVNDTLGHPVGDALLEQVGQRLRRCLRESDIVARLGGDEFAIAFLGDDAELAAAHLADRIIRDLGAHYEIGDHVVTIGVSVGVALSDNGPCDADTLMKNADMALYEAKGQGRGTWRQFATAMRDTLHARLELETEMKSAVRNGQFAIAYQPLVSLATGRVSGYEALLRWNHPARGLVSPAEFIPIAEESNRIVDIGAWCIDRALHDMRAAPPDVKLAVNLSPVQLRSDAIVAVVADALQRSGCNPNRLELEITESALIEDSEQIVARLYELHRMGVRIVLDDFGTGFSSLNYLRRFPFQKIKIDKVFVREAIGREDCSAIIASVVGLAEKLGMTTTAEGIETEEQLALVGSLGCTEGQGFLFGRPQPIADALNIGARGQILPRKLARAC